jgi:hypothetical protein
MDARRGRERHHSGALAALDGLARRSTSPGQMSSDV